ncbi:S1 RNA binding domain protein [Aedoeadaptatus coxii]|uniref:ribonuclease E/G n=1 Tax=Aedoeadaptatus coxii TaxID=755172 RepID=UPI00176B1CAD|nr:ribonuclease E/G [Peptoniphilus coxii]CAC9929547.1 S1 RNA binding domain protein [Peptoniphilus coxii]
MKYNSRDYLFIDGEAPCLIGLIQGDEITAVHLLSKDSQVGNIYRGYVKNVLPAMDCAFVDFGHRDTGYLPMKNIYPKEYREKIKGGDTVIVEVKKMPLREKRAVLSLDYSLRGEYLVLLPESRGVRLSKKIDDESIRTSLKEWAKSLPWDRGMIIRTEAAICDRSHLDREFSYLYAIYDAIEKSRQFLPPTKLLRTQDHGLDILSKYGDLPVVINDKRFKERIGEDRNIIVDPSFSIRSMAKWRSKFNAIFSKTVALPSGGNIVINTAEACQVIDVNSGSVKKSGSFSDMRRRLNREAAEMLVKHIKLRNLSGMIVVDFVHGMDEGERKDITSLIEEGLKDDMVITTVFGFTAMGLFEIARQRRDLRFEEQYELAKRHHQEALKEKIKRENSL